MEHKIDCDIPMPEPNRLSIEADCNHLETLRRFVEQAARQGNAHSEDVDDMILAATEAATNIILHGYQGQPGSIQIEVKYEGDDLVVRLRDQAPPFDPTTAPPPDLSLPLEKRPLGGMGIHIMRRLTDRLVYRVNERGGNELTLIKKVTRKA